MGGFYLSAAHKSSGKTTVAVGLAAAFARQGLRVAPFKKGPDYIDPLWLSAAAGRSCYNLDFHTEEPPALGQRFRRTAGDADIAFVEGNKGLYDGVAADGSNSNAALAALLGLPVLLVLDCRGMTRGVAPLLLGYQQFGPELRWAGVVLNRVGGSRHQAKLEAAVSGHTDFVVLGSIPELRDMALHERYLGLIPPNEASTRQAVLDRLADTVAKGVDMAALGAVSASLPIHATAMPPGKSGELRIGVARDEAFGFYYPDDLEALERHGARLVFFSPLADSRLPELDGLFLGGGFPEQFMSALAANPAMRRSIRDAAAAGLPVYAECGGLMYLCRRLLWGDRAEAMCDIIPADAVMGDRPVGRGYVYLRETAAHPWPGGQAGARIACHEFHYSTLVGLEAGASLAYAVERGHGIDGSGDGWCHNNVLASYSHLRGVGSCHWPERYVAFVRGIRQQTGGKRPWYN